MFRSALRTSTRVVRASRTTGPVQRRFASSSSRKGTWKGAAVRWGAAGGALYWYNTSPLFQEEPIPQAIAPPPHFSEHDSVTVEAVVEEKRRQAEARAAAAAAAAPVPEAAPVQDGEALPKSPEELEEEAGQQGAFNPETGEINWDCPCLGGMAHGPCGEEFKAAFSCFVYSTEEPKGMDCIEKFQHMQDCFRKYPEIYAPELADDEEAEAEAAAAAAATKGTAPPSGVPQGAEATGANQSKPEAPGKTSPPVELPAETPKAPVERIEKSETEKTPAGVTAAEEVMKPKKAFDATDANRETAQTGQPGASK